MAAAASGAPVAVPAPRLTVADAKATARAALRRRYGRRGFALECAAQSARRVTCTARAGRTRVTVSVRQDGASAAASLRAKPVR